jgi:hypothetical protein
MVTPRGTQLLSRRLVVGGDYSRQVLLWLPFHLLPDCVSWSPRVII